MFKWLARNFVRVKNSAEKIKMLIKNLKCKFMLILNMVFISMLSL